MKILIAEDDPNTGQFLKIILNKVGYETVMATSGSQAWEILQQEDSPKLAIFDWMMPGMSGVELCKKLRMTNERIRTYVILLTARSEMNDIITGLKSGADDYITKPFNRIELLARLKVGERSLDLQNQLVARIQNLEEAARRNQLLGEALQSKGKPAKSTLPKDLGVDHILARTLTQMGVGTFEVQKGNAIDHNFKPDFTAWTCLFLEQQSVALDIKVEIDRPSAEAMLAKIVNNAKVSDEKILDMLSEILNITQSNSKPAFNEKGIQIISPYTPKATLAGQVISNGYDSDEIDQFHFKSSKINMKLEVIKNSASLVEKSPSELHSFEVVAKPVCWPDNKERIILNKGILLNEFYILKLSDVSHMREDGELKVSVYKPSPLSSVFQTVNNRLVEAS